MSTPAPTGTFCLLLLLLTVFPCLLVEGPSLDTLHTVLTVQSGLERSDCSTSLHTLHTLHHNVLYTCVGAWLGAVPLPLDWDRDWQVWPISCCLGAALGHALAAPRWLWVGADTVGARGRDCRCNCECQYGRWTWREYQHQYQRY